MIGIYGGSFDPIHHGHLRIALEVQQTLNLQQVRFLPLNIPAHKNQPITSNNSRLSMLESAVNQQLNFVIDSQELNRQETSYTVDSLKNLRKTHPDIPLIFMLGSDAFNHIHKWSRYEQLLELAHLVVMQRPNETHKITSPYFSKHQITDPIQLKQKPFGHLLLLPVTQLDISSSQIRQLIQQGKSARYLTPDSVLDIIQQKHLYQD